MSSKSRIINGVFFKTQSALIDHVKRMLHSAVFYQQLDESDFEFMLEVLKGHPEYLQKAGCGIASIYVKPNPIFPSTHGFWIVRSDGSETDFSYKECFNASTDMARFKQACRAAVEPVTMKFKSDFFEHLPSKSSICPYTGEDIWFTNSDVNHKSPNEFASIVAGFIEDNHIDVSSVKVNGRGEDGVCQDTFEPDMAERFVEYHNKRAQLEVISPTANRIILRKVAAK